MANPRGDRKELERRDQEEPAEVGLEGAAEKNSGVLRDAEVEGGEELSIGGGPPEAAGGEVHSSLPTHKDVHDLES